MKFFPRAILIILATILVTGVLFVDKRAFADTTSCPAYLATGFNSIVLDNSNPLAFSAGLLSVTNQSKLGTYSTTDKCVIGGKAAIPEFSLLSYQEMKSIYFTQNRSTSFTKSSLGGGTNIISLTGTNRLYSIGGSLNLTTSLYPSSGTYKTGVVFVDGDLNITANINSTNNTDKESTGLVFVTQGNVNIDPAVTQIDAFIITYGTFCSYFSGGTCPLTSQDTTPLTISGSIVSLTQNSPPQFKRANGTNLNAAETINYVPKYLVILKDIFSKDLNIWSEVTG